LARSSTIDAFRGIAAICVVVQHLLLSWPDPMVQTLHAAVYYTPLEALFSDGKFIRVFFVVSGFVMFAPLAKAGPFSWREFYVRRFWRIYPVFVAAVAISVCVHFLLPDPGTLAGATAWFSAEAQQETVTVASVMQILLFAGTEDAIRLNCVTWSLVQEVRVIILFPLLAYCVRKSGTMTWIWVCAVSMVASHIYPLIGETRFFITAETPLGSLCTTLHFLPLFVIGMILAQRIELFSDLLALTTTTQRVLLWVAAFVLIRRSQEYIAGPAAALLIFMAMRTPWVARALSVQPLQWLGKISYSLYLLHIPVLALTLHVLNGVLPISQGLLVAFMMSLLFAHVFEERLAMLFAYKKRGKIPRLAGSSLAAAGPSWRLAQV
jgi:peptidoglycan/LPS O-acetylase OafA/YrhL